MFIATTAFEFIGAIALLFLGTSAAILLGVAVMNFLIDYILTDWEDDE